MGDRELLLQRGALTMLHINDLFWTFQGEGFHAGRRALFVRLPFCNLACTWCDTTFNTFQKVSEADFTKFATQERARFAVITGGEPTMNKHTPRIVQILKSLGFYVAMESNGTFPRPEGIDWLTVSPKRFTSDKGMAAFHVHANAFSTADEFKYVVDGGFPFDILDRHEPIAATTTKHYLSPEFSRFKDSLAEIAAFIEKRPGWRVSLQSHKWADWK
jgi:7-carboxy-7-deazaguanine synthase